MSYVIALLLVAGPADLHKRAVDSFDRADFRRAAELLQQDLQQQIGGRLEQKTRELLVLALYNAGRKDEAVNAYKTLLERFPDYRFNDDEVLPDTIAFFETRVPRVAPKPPDAIQAAPDPVASAPVELKAAPPQKRFHWYYLVPLGVGQFLAGSPVRGTIFLVLQAGFLAMNLAGYYALYNAQALPDGTFDNAASARTGMLLTNIAFGGLMGSIVAGIIDAAAFERGP
ncbi:MAG: hypothetical protein IT381_00965 [Deltaproteobacteria bacterium]|nr:hypothetical protein [Deltaproteobacteria bacterium]